MKPRHIRAFKVRKQLFHLTDRGDGTLVVTSIHPYDEIEYHSKGLENGVRSNMTIFVTAATFDKYMYSLLQSYVSSET